MIPTRSLFRSLTAGQRAQAVIAQELPLGLFVDRAAEGHDYGVDLLLRPTSTAYAAAPVGELRWRPPRRAANSAGWRRSS